MSVNVIYQLWSDNVADFVTPVASAADAAYPAANLIDFNPAKPAKLTTTTGDWVWDFGVAQRIDLAAIIHHNLTAALNVRLQGNATNVWGAPTFDQQITIPAYFGDGYPGNPWMDLTVKAGYSAGGFRFWRLRVEAANAAAVAIGDVWLSPTIRRLQPNIDWGTQTTKERKQVEHGTDFGVVNVYDLGVTVRQLKGHLDTTDAQAALVEAWWRDVRGRVRPFLLIPNGDVNEAMLVRFGPTQQDLTLTLIDRNDFDLDFQEVGRGLVL